MSKSLLVIAGEISGDMHVAPILRALQEADPAITCWGIGGDQLRETGMEILYDARDMAVVGVWEVLRRYLFFRRVFRQMLYELDVRKPDAVLLVDYPGFNLRFARAAHRRGIKVLYYICPQVWAWHRSRIQQMARIVDRLMVIFPFEVDVFKETALHVDFVGHPLVNATQATLNAEPTTLPWSGETNRLALLPGSRKQEVERILPVMLDAVNAIRQQRDTVACIIAAPSERVAEWSRVILDQRGARCPIVVGQTREVVRQARAAMVASGTATMETALMGCPFIVVYKTAPMTYWLGKRLVRVPYLGMVNIVARRELCPEFLQDAAEPQAMGAAVLPLLDESPERKKMLDGLNRIAERLGRVDPVDAAAQIIRAELTS